MTEKNQETEFQPTISSDVSASLFQNILHFI